MREDRRDGELGQLIRDGAQHRAGEVAPDIGQPAEVPGQHGEELVTERPLHVLGGGARDRLHADSDLLEFLLRFAQPLLEAADRRRPLDLPAQHGLGADARLQLGQLLLGGIATRLLDLQRPFDRDGHELELRAFRLAERGDLSEEAQALSIGLQRLKAPLPFELPSRFILGNFGEIFFLGALPGRLRLSLEFPEPALPLPLLDGATLGLKPLEPYLGLLVEFPEPEAEVGEDPRGEVGQAELRELRGFELGIDRQALALDRQELALQLLELAELVERALLVALLEGPLEPELPL
ncbi:MAG TPA: hypothetical protein VNJ53_07755, partial [Gaiellaceae bacterium]|nr:hypothetical protein [Gaiellaceae bacterium]